MEIKLEIKVEEDAVGDDKRNKQEQREVQVQVREEAQGHEEEMRRIGE